MITGIVLAGGASRRIGQNKMALPLGDRSMIERAVSSLAPFCVLVLVVTGEYHDEIVSLLKETPNVRILYNPFHRQGMFTSVLTGANAAPEGDLLILPGDIPFVQSSTMKALLDGSGVIRVPIHQGRRGHPLFLHREVASALRHEPSTSNLREFRDRYEVTEIAVEDPAIDQDIDTIEDYERFRSGKDSI